MANLNTYYQVEAFARMCPDWNRDPGHYGNLKAFTTLSCRGLFSFRRLNSCPCKLSRGRFQGFFHTHNLSSGAFDELGTPTPP